MNLMTEYIKKFYFKLLTKKKGRFILGFKLFEGDFDKIQRVYVKYHDFTKRKLMWNI